MPDVPITQTDLNLLLDTYKQQIRVTENVLHAVNDQTHRIKEAITDMKVSITASINSLNAVLESARRDSLKEHAELKHKIYIALIGMLGILATLVTSILL